MAGEARLDRVYAELMLVQPWGWALYKKVLAKDIKPGMCGYFDAEGDWQLILDLEDRGDDCKQWEAVSPPLQLKEPQALTWGPKKSSKVEQRKIGATIGATIAVAPIEPSLTLNFSTYGEGGAVLVTEAPVMQRQVQSQGSLTKWMQQNAKALLDPERYGANAAENGIWIVTKTYTTKRCALAVMTSKSSSVEIGVAASVQGLFVLDPSASWSSSASGSSTDIHEDKDGVVVFMSGIYFKKRKLLPGLKSETKQEGQRPFLRGANDHGQDPSPISYKDRDGEDQLLDIEYYGKLE